MTTAARHPCVSDAVARLPRVVDLLAARAQEHDRDACFPYQGIEAVHEAGLLTLTVAERYGGAAGGLADTVRVLVELGRGDPSVALVTALTLLTHAEQARAPYWPEAAYAELLADSARGPALVGLLGPEPTLGDASVVARREDGFWRLTGRRSCVPGAEALAWMAVSARTDEDEPRELVFLVQGDTPGVQVEPTWDQLGLRATASHDVLFDGVLVAADAVVAQQATLGALWCDLALPAVYLGVAQAARDWLVRSLHTPLPESLDALHHAALGRVEIELVGAEELLLSLARQVDAGDPRAADRTGAVRLLVTRAAIGAVEHAVALSGSGGLSRAHPLERHLRDVQHARLQGPHEHEILTTAGRRALQGR
ncbi:alkylation response protein AidB-like acyl-CoA dehydrogenase [Streptacidiphilus sp. MAP12-16]|uniref:acyl-CoA dehydrogenase family protein n=1 Tax=Streptacidiphilus sp. MAP12-16 TaxID=3156300 RepID=UPI00351463D4